MTKIDIKGIVENLIPTFLDAGKLSLVLRKKGLIKKMKSDNTPVSNGDLEVNQIITQEIRKLTPQVPIVSEETSENKSTNMNNPKTHLNKTKELTNPKQIKTHTT